MGKTNMSKTYTFAFLIILISIFNITNCSNNLIKHKPLTAANSPAGAPAPTLVTPPKLTSSSSFLPDFSKALGPEEKGYCVDKNDRDVNSGVKKIKGGDYKTEAKKQECLKLCAAHKGFTGCETIFDQDNKGCYVHTSKAITHGNR